MQGQQSTVDTDERRDHARERSEGCAFVEIRHRGMEMDAVRHVDACRGHAMREVALNGIAGNRGAGLPPHEPVAIVVLAPGVALVTFSCSLRIGDLPAQSRTLSRRHVLRSGCRPEFRDTCPEVAEHAGSAIGEDLAPAGFVSRFSIGAEPLEPSNVDVSREGA